MRLHRQAAPPAAWAAAGAAYGINRIGMVVVRYGRGEDLLFWKQDHD
jgi:hypothetical protein